MALSPGDPAPTIALPNQHGERVSPDFEAPTVLYLYPEDGTPGCRTEAVQFQAEAEMYAESGVTVYGVSTDSVESHRSFADAHDIEFDLLADPDGDVADAFELDLESGRYPRTTFVLVGGEVHRVYENVSADGQARDLLLDLLDDGLVSIEGF